MANENAKKNQIWMKLGTRWFSKSLITNLNSKCRNSKRPDQNAKSYFFRMKLCIGGFLGLLIMNLNTKFRKNGRSNMADQNAKS